MTMSCVSGSLAVIVMLCVLKDGLAENEEYKSLPYTDEQRNYIAEEVCMTFVPLESEKEKYDNCLKNFLGPSRRFSAAPSKLRPVCRTNDTVSFTVTPPATHWQVVALIPEDPDFIFLTEIKLINPLEEIESIRIPSNKPSDFWTAALDKDGTPSIWLRGPRVPPWGNQDYSMVVVEGPSFKYNGGLRLEAVFGFVFPEGIHHCTTLDITNSCQKRTTGDVSKYSFSYKSLNRKLSYQKSRKQVLIWSDPNIPLDDECELIVWRDTERIVVKTYNSSGVPETQFVKELIKQYRAMHGIRAVQDLTLDLEATESGWKIKVKWTAPRIRPEKYNITLRTTEVMKTFIVPGTETEFVFTNVPGKDIPFYNVTVISLSARGKLAAQVSQWGKFPAPERIKNVTLKTYQSGIGWEVCVKWERPAQTPSKYRLILRTPETFRNITIDGTATEYTFKNVLGKENALYNVTITTITPRGFANTDPKRARFPERMSYQTVIVTGAWSIVLTLAAAAIGIYVWWRRRRDGYSGYFPSLVKLPKDIESCNEPCTEDSWEVCSDRLKLKEVIGEGAFGVVRKGILEPGGREVAVKMLKDFPTVEEIRSFRAEMELMKSVGAHPHIVSLVGCCSGRRPRIVAEYCSRGDLLHLLRYSWDLIVLKRNAKYYNNNMEGADYRNDLFKSQKDSKLAPLVNNKLYDFPDELTPSDLLSFCRQIAMGMEFLASNRVVHRDLAARNILVTSDRTVKIADFGLSRDIYQENQYKQKGNGKLPIKWMALESLTNRIYTTQSDVWSFGVVVWEVVTVGGAPYPDVPCARLPRLLRAGYRMPRPGNCSDQLYDVMMACWRARARERPTFAELHRRLDELLNSACADEYLSLELDEEAPPTPKPTRYIKKLFKGNRVWARGENYEWPLKKLQSNYYTAAPASIAKPQAV